MVYEKLILFAAVKTSHYFLEKNVLLQNEAFWVGLLWKRLRFMLTLDLERKNNLRAINEPYTKCEGF